MYHRLFCLFVAASAAFSPLASAQDCSVPSLPPLFTARLAWQSGNTDISSVATVAVGNMNPLEDSIPEIIVGEGGSLTADSRLIFFRGDGTNAASPKYLTLPSSFDTYPVPGPTLGDIDKDGIPELLISCKDRTIRVYKNYSETTAEPMQLWVTSSSALDYTDQRPLLADFNGDGIPEVYAGSDIYAFNLSNPAAPTLDKLIDGPVNRGRANYSSYLEGACNPTAVDLLSVADCNGDPDCAGLELAAGPVIYSIDLTTSDGDGFQIKVKRDLNLMMAPSMAFGDGYTAAADMDLDGITDVVVASRRLTPNTETGVYVWNKNGLIRFLPYPINVINSGGMPCIANVYDDTKSGFATDLPEIISTCAINLTCFSLHASDQDPTAPWWWALPTSDQSGWTGTSVYDFNGDGISEIVYRDEQNFRIMYGGPEPLPSGVDYERNWYKHPCFSGTADEYPVVADADNDGETEVIISGSTAYLGGKARLNVFKSDGYPWAPCRNIWNQFNYFVTNVNDDLSIPAQQPDHTVEYPAPGSGNRPFNQYLAQRPLLNDNYQTYFLTPDATASVLSLDCEQENVTIALQICNHGDAVLPSGIPVSFYEGNPAVSATNRIGWVHFTPNAISPDSCIIQYITLPRADGEVFGVINADSTNATPLSLSTQTPLNFNLECNWLNNLFSFQMPELPDFSGLGPDQGACKDTAILLDAGAGFVSYEWNNNTSGQFFAASIPGIYWVEATDQCGLILRDTIRMLLYDSPVVSIDTLNGNCDGFPSAILASATTIFPPLSYKWSSGATVASVFGLPDGFYTVTVTNAKGCTTTGSSWVEGGGNLQTELEIVSPVLCHGGAGHLRLNFLIGEPPYSYLWSNGNTTSEITAATAGGYGVTVSDASGCMRIHQIFLPEPTELSSLGTAAIHACPGESNGTAIFTGAFQGTPPYTFIWSNGATTNQINNLPAGVYPLTLTDANGCMLRDTAVVIENIAPTFSATQEDISCAGAANGSVTLNVTGGTPTVSYLWSNGATTGNISGLQPGQYDMVILYAGGMCSEDLSFQITEPAPLQTDFAAVTPVSCAGLQDGSVNLSFSGGTAPYKYLWSNGQQTEDLAGADAGTYSVTLTDANQCTLAKTFLIDEPLPIILADTTITHVTCHSQQTGAINTIFTGGTTPYQFLWSNGAQTGSLAGVGAGTYSVTLSDSRQCAYPAVFQISEPPALSLATTATSDTCQQADASVTTIAGGGSPPLSFLWTNGQTTGTLNGLSAGNYGVTVTDANGCTITGQTVVAAADLYPVLGTQSGLITCAVPVVQIGVTANQQNLHYSWSAPGGTLPDTPAHTVSVPGYYSVTATNSFGCSTNIQIIVSSDTTPPVAEAGPAQLQVGCNDFFTVLDASASSSGNQYLHRWQLFQQGSVALDTQAVVIPIPVSGLYRHTVVNTNNGCVSSDSILVFRDPPVSAAITTEPVKCFGDRNGAIRFVNVTGGHPPYYYSIGSKPYSAQSEYTGLVPGNYTLRIRDDFGCFWNSTITLDTPVELSVALTLSDTAIELGQPVTLQAIPAPPDWPLSEIHWLPEQFEYTPLSLLQTVYPEVPTVFTIRVVDENGCAAEDQRSLTVYSNEFYVPNVIKPESGENGWFTIFGGNGVSSVRLLRVYDRWGTLVFERAGFHPGQPESGWDGTAKGEPVDPGVFVWYAELEMRDGRILSRKGDVTVVR